MESQPECVTADGGNATIINQDEMGMLDRCVSEVPMVVAAGGADDFSHVNPQFREKAI